MAVPRAMGQVALHYWVASAVGKNKIVLRNQGPKGIRRIVLDARQRRGRIYIPECDLCFGGATLQHFPFEPFVVRTHSTMFDHQIGALSALQQHWDFTRSVV